MEKGIYNNWNDLKQAVELGEINPIKIRKVVVYLE